MPDMNSEDVIEDVKLQAFTEDMILWAKHVLGRRDFIKSRPAPHEFPSQSVPALDTIFQGYCSFRGGMITPDTWAGVTRIIKILMSTEHFLAHWEMREEQFPEDFRDFMNSTN